MLGVAFQSHAETRNVSAEVCEFGQGSLMVGCSLGEVVLSPLCREFLYGLKLGVGGEVVGGVVIYFQPERRVFHDVSLALGLRREGKGLV